ncbi:trypsin-1-like [Mercenaria mercenaria]|uniref:trypsin-1-like n=1 Tax=Mercenaria mercenaria TaxID=6596 RepID=UPI00234EECC7|nr:trypsin-1-like [Mercenaria mercenaria]
MYPWQVGIQRRKGKLIHWCGGTLINSQWILSAAHCYKDLTKRQDGRNRKVNYEDFRVHIGDHDLKKPDEYEKIFHIEYLVKHWNYSDTDRTHPIHDVALLKINSSVVFNGYVQPACLPGENDPLNYGMKCEVSGWGERNESGGISDKLMAAEVPIVDKKKCKEFLERYPIDSQGMFCAGEINIDACQGDSGGPLVCDMNDKNTVIGITSWGDGCGKPNAPGVYTNVAAYVSWIKEQISLHESAGSKCPVLRSPNNGEVKVEGDKAHFRCDEGFILEGSHTVTCQQGGRWDGIIPVCKSKFSTTKPLMFQMLVKQFLT